jgi:hypothetical protein
MLSTTTRAVIAGLGVLLALSGLAASTAGAGLAGVWATIIGCGLVVAVVLERNRYRSEEADRAFEVTGPGGGEPAGPVEPRFHPTDELFVDPTTGVRMRVHVDPRTGERRYIGDG